VGDALMWGANRQLSASTRQTFGRGFCRACDELRELGLDGRCKQCKRPSRAEE